MYVQYSVIVMLLSIHSYVHEVQLSDELMIANEENVIPTISYKLFFMKVYWLMLPAKLIVAKDENVNPIMICRSILALS